MSKNNGKGWTPKEEKYFGKGYNDAKIAKLTGRTPGAVSVKRSALKKEGAFSKPAKTRKSARPASKPVESNGNTFNIVSGQNNISITGPVARVILSGGDVIIDAK